MEWPSAISFDGDFWMVTIRTMLSHVFVQRHEIYSHTLETIECLSVRNRPKPQGLPFLDLNSDSDKRVVSTKHAV